MSEVSDLFVGIAPQPGLLPEKVSIPLLPATRVWRDDLLRVYFEIYHPGLVADGDTRRFEIRLQVLRRADERAGDGERESATAAIVVALESVAPTGTHHLDLDLRNEEFGPLEIVLTVTDTATDETYVRIASIFLLDS